MAIEQVRPSELAHWLQAQSADGPPGVVLDVREPWEIERASAALPGFPLLAMPMNEIPDRIAQLDPEQPVACLCHHGTRSQRVAVFLAQNGFTHVANVAGGIEAWSRELDPAVPRY